MSTQHARRFSRRRFLGRLMLAGTAGLLGPYARQVAAEPPPETTRLRLVQTPSICQAPSMWPKHCCTARDSPRCTIFRKRGPLTSRRPCLRRSRHQCAFRRTASPPAGGGGPHCHSGGAPHRLLRTLRDARGPHHPRPEGEDHRRTGVGFRPLRVLRQHGGVCGPGPPQGCQRRHASETRVDPAPERGEDRCLPGFPPRTAGDAGEADRPRRGEQHRGPALVAIFVAR